MLPNAQFDKGFIGYVVHDLDGKVLLEFGEKNIPAGFTKEKLFVQICQSERNKSVLELLEGSGILAAKIPETFPECCSAST